MPAESHREGGRRREGGDYVGLDHLHRHAHHKRAEDAGLQTRHDKVKTRSREGGGRIAGSARIGSFGQGAWPQHCRSAASHLGPISGLSRAYLGPISRLSRALGGRLCPSATIRCPGAGARAQISIYLSIYLSGPECVRRLKEASATCPPLALAGLPVPATCRPSVGPNPGFPHVRTSRSPASQVAQPSY